MKIIAIVYVSIMYIILTYLLTNDLLTNDFDGYNSESKGIKILLFVTAYVLLLAFVPLILSITIAIKLFSWAKSIK